MENGVSVIRTIVAVYYCCMEVALQVLLPLWSVLSETERNIVDYFKGKHHMKAKLMQLT
jgi:hypothetical protein